MNRMHYQRTVESATKYREWLRLALKRNSPKVVLNKIRWGQVPVWFQEIDNISLIRILTLEALIRSHERMPASERLTLEVETDKELLAYSQKLSEVMGSVHNTDVFLSWGKTMAMFELAGKHFYEVSPGLADKLANTELRGLTTEDLRLPFESICFHVPKEAGLHVLEEESPCESIYLFEDSDRNGERNWLLMIAGSPWEGQPLNNNMIAFQFALPAGITMDAAIKENVRRLSGAEVPMGVADSLRAWPDFFRWAMNAVIYATWPAGDRRTKFLNKPAAQLRARMEKLPRGKKKERLGNQLKTLELNPVVVLGANVRLEGTGNEATATGQPRGLRVRVRVMGHWRHQAFGRNRSERRLQWIEPFWRGSEDLPLSTPTYKMVA